jgi:GDP-4-dehydro-6-deoxy-D-mannose reductase
MGTLNTFLITGFSGFVSKHFLDFLEKNHAGAVVYGIDIQHPDFDLSAFKNIHCHFKVINLLDAQAVSDVLVECKPNYILHLASYSSVAFSWEQPVTAFVNNLNIFLNLVDQIRLLKLSCKILSVGSSEEYGKVDPNFLPLTEDGPVNPISPYAVARVSQEQLSSVYSAGFGLDIVMTRSFNHIGPGQLDKFVIPSFVKKILETNQSGGSYIEVGNVELVRDFVDVRDVVAAYYHLLMSGRKGEIYNICSGKGISLKEMLVLIMELIGCQLEIKTIESLVRPNDNEVIVGSYHKIHQELGWEPTYSLQQSLADIIQFWKTKLGSA